MNARFILRATFLATVALGLSLPAGATSPSPKMKMTTTMAPGIATPDKVKSRLGELKFFAGFPDKATVDKLNDNLDFQRAVQAYLLALPAVSQAYNRSEILKLGPANTTVPIFENRMDSKSVFLTPNTETPYSWMWIDLRKGPVVLEAPPKVLGALNDMWYRWVVDIGFTGPDKGAGGKFLILPPGYKDAIPDGYIVVKSPTFSLWAPWRSFVVDGDPKPGVDLVKKHTRAYLLCGSRQPAGDELRQCLRPRFRHRRARRLRLLGPAQPGCPGGAQRIARPGPPWLLRLARHRQGASRSRRMPG
jgi:hypothetical protein